MSPNRLQQKEPNESFEEYVRFVKEVTPKTVTEMECFAERLIALNDNELCDSISRLITGSSGMCAETGAIQKTVIDLIHINGKLDYHAVYELKGQLGDVLFYWVQMCVALGLNTDELLDINKQKILARIEGDGSADLNTKRTVNDL